jgi:tetratricopeptide (TPR) repeat protein
MRKMSVIGLALGLTLGSAVGGALRADGAALNLGKQDSPTALRDGERLMASGDYAIAVTVLQSVGVQSESAREAQRLSDLAKSFLYTGYFEQAENTATQALALDKSREEAWSTLGAAQVFEMRRSIALETFSKGVAELKAAHKNATHLAATHDYLQALVQEQDGSMVAAK